MEKRNCIALVELMPRSSGFGRTLYANTNSLICGRTPGVACQRDFLPTSSKRQSAGRSD